MPLPPVRILFNPARTAVTSSGIMTFFSSAFAVIDGMEIIQKARAEGDTKKMVLGGVIVATGAIPGANLLRPAKGLAAQGARMAKILDTTSTHCPGISAVTKGFLGDTGGAAWDSANYLCSLKIALMIKEANKMRAADFTQAANIMENYTKITDPLLQLATTDTLSRSLKAFKTYSLEMGPRVVGEVEKICDYTSQFQPINSITIDDTYGFISI